MKSHRPLGFNLEAMINYNALLRLCQRSDRGHRRHGRSIEDRNCCMNRTLGLAILLASSSFAVAADANKQGIALFESKIRPVLIQHCYKCHSAEAKKNKKLKAGLYLDTSAGVLRGGETGPAIVAGKPKDSLLIRAIKHEDADMKMPPKSKLPADVIAGGNPARVLKPLGAEE